MTSFIPRLARILSGRDAGKKRAPAIESGARHAIDRQALVRLAPEIRQRLAISRQFSDKALLASLESIVTHSSNEERWRAAEASTLGQYLAGSGNDMHRTLVTLLSMLPSP